MTHIIFLGAGASAAEGAPVQSALIQRIVEKERLTGILARRSFSLSPTTSHPDARNYLESIFGLNPESDCKPPPTFEEVLGIIDYAIGRNQGLGTPQYSPGSRGRRFRTPIYSAIKSKGIKGNREGKGKGIEAPTAKRRPIARSSKVSVG